MRLRKIRNLDPPKRDSTKIILTEKVSIICMSVLCSGSFVADFMVPNLSQIGAPGSLTYAPNGIMFSPGGHSSNVAVDLSQLGLRDVHATGSIGNDPMGKLLVDHLKSKVTVHPEIQKETTTAKNIALLVENQDRRFIAELTANSLLSSGFVEKILDAVRPRIFYQGTLGGLPHIECGLSDLLGHAKSLGAATFLDVIVPSNGWGYLADAYRDIDFLHCNLGEARGLTGLVSPVDIVGHLLEEGIGMVVVSDGANGLTAGLGDAIIEMPAFMVEAVDSTGAGDALCAGMIYYKTLNMETWRDDLLEMLLMGQAAGAACVTGIGATLNVTIERVRRILEHKNEVLEKTVHL